VTSTVAGYPSQWVGGSNFTTATPTVFSSSTTLNIALAGTPVAGVLSGVVTADGAPVPNAILSIYNLAGVGVGAYADASGAYSISLPPDTYKIHVTSSVAGYPSQWVGGSNFTTATATAFSATATQNIALVSVLPPMGTFAVGTANGLRTVTLRINSIGGSPIVPGDKLSVHFGSASSAPNGWACIGTTSDFCNRVGPAPLWGGYMGMTPGFGDLYPLATADANGVIYYTGPMSKAVQWQVGTSWRIIGTL
jgi:hypothetical protein